MKHTVVVVGAGPTGLMLASELALAGVGVVVLERRAEPNARSRGMAMHGRSLELFKQRGLADRIPPDQIFTWPRTPFSLLWLNLGGVAETEYTHAYPQWRVERLLEQRAVELGVDIRRDHEVLGYQPDPTGVTVEVRSAAGVSQLRGDYLVGCDGENSVVRELAGIDFVGGDDTYYGAFADVPMTDGIDFDSTVRPTGVFGALPIEPGILRLMTLEFGTDRPSDDVPVTLDEVRASIRRVTGRDLEIPEAYWVSRFGGPTRLAESYRKGRVFLAGDAAHSLFISGTQAMNAGLQDAANLGWKLAAELNGWAPPELLDTYDGERHPVGERICLHARASLGLLHPLGKVEALREFINDLIQMDSVNRHLLQMTTTARYPLGERSDGTDPHPLLGRPVPDAELKTVDGGTTVARTLHSGRGVVLDLSDGRLDPEGLSGWADRVDVVVADPTPELDASVLLVRPDGHVAHVDSTGADQAGLRSALATWFGGER